MMKQFEKWQRVLVLLIISLLVATTWAVDESYTMNVNLTDGKIMTFTLTSQKPSVYCYNGLMTIHYYDQESEQYHDISFERELVKDLTFNTTYLQPATSFQNIIVGPNKTPVLIDDIDRVTYEVDIEGTDTTGENPDILKMYLKDGSVYSELCGKYSASISLFKYYPYNNTYTSTTNHQNDYSAEWNVNYVGQKEGCYSVGIFWMNNLSGFKNVRSGICFGTSPNLTIEQCDHCLYVDDSSEFPYNRSNHYMFVGSKLSLPIRMQGCSFGFDDQAYSDYIKIGEDNCLNIPLEYGKTYFYRTFVQGEMMQHGEMKTVTCYDVEKSFRVPRVLEDAGYKGFPIPTEEACQTFGSHFPDSVTAPSREQIKDLWHEWQQTDDAQQIDLSPYCTPIEFDNGTTYELNRIPYEFYKWLTNREIVFDVYRDIAKVQDASYQLVYPDESWNVPNGYYMRFNPTTATSNSKITYHNDEVIPGVRYKLKITFAPNSYNEDTRPTRLKIWAQPMGIQLYNPVDIPATEITTLETEDIVTAAMGMDLVIQVSVNARQTATYSREVRIAEIRLAPENTDSISLQEVVFWQHETGLWALDAPKTTQATPAWVIGEPTGQPYGDSSVNNWADLSGFDQLVITYTDGTPRVMMNRDQDEGQFSATESESHLIEYPKCSGSWAGKYFTDKNGVLTVDLKAIVNDKGYAHLHAIKSANWANVTVMSMYLYSEDENIEVEEWQLLKNAYSAMGEGNGWKRRWNFSESNPSVKVLPGVTVENGHVKAITLADNNLTGTFPVLLLSLPYLEDLNLSNNALSGDIGVTMATYTFKNPSLQIPLKTINISGNRFTGNIGLFANCFPNLKSLNASRNCLEDVYPMISPNVTSLNIGQQTINRIVELDLSNLTVEAMAGKLPSILLYNHAKQTFIPEISILCTTGDLTDYLNNWSIILSYKNGKATVPYASDANVYYGKSGDVLNVGVVDDDGSLEGTTFRIKLNFDNGDANFDGLVNVLDVQTDIMYIFENFKTRPFNFTAANLWSDVQINVQDIVTLVNLIFETKTPAAPSLRRSASTSEAEAIVFCRNGSLIVNTTRPVAAFDITLSGCSNINVKALSQQGFLCESRKTRDGLRLIGYSLSRNTLPVGKTVVGLTNTNVATVYSVQLADTDALEIQSAVGDGNSTGISTISMPKRNSEEIYRIPLGDGHAISIDSQGRKTLINNSKTVK